MSDAGVVKVESVEQYTEFFRGAILEKLEGDREALKAFEVSRFQPDSQQRRDLKAAGVGNLINISGALGLDDSGANWRAFSVQVEEGLSASQDTEMAESLAHQCLICVAQMKKENAKGASLHHVH